jgi:hypothetical protein
LKDVEEVGDGSDGQYLVPKDDTVITKVVPRTDAEVPHFSR